MGAELVAAALALHRWLVRAHWNGEGLVGPDCGVRFNYRAGRFVKAYLRGLPWRDDLYYLQGQGYWMLANWRLHELTGDRGSADIALRCARGVVARQRLDGAWTYPNREWRGRVASAEGSWAAIGLLESYRHSQDESLLAAAVRWHRCLEREIGYQPVQGGLAANYFAHDDGSPVPNTTAFVLRLLSELADVTGDRGFLEPTPDLTGFLSAAQADNGELPYQVPAGDERVRHAHFQCLQYNAFQCLDLLRCAELTASTEARDVAARLAGFLLAHVRADGRVPYACDRTNPEVTYHAAAVATALAHAAGSAEDPARAASARVLTRVLARQRSDGSFPHSSGDYGVLRDVRSYPRHLSMMLLHLLMLAAREPPTAEVA